VAAGLSEKNSPPGVSVFFGGLGADVSGFCFLKNSRPGWESSRQGEEKFFCHSQKNFRFFFEAIRAEIVYARGA
jgi:hypothetical protein